MVSLSSGFSAHTRWELGAVPITLFHAFSPSVRLAFLQPYASYAVSTDDANLGLRVGSRTALWFTLQAPVSVRLGLDVSYAISNRDSFNGLLATVFAGVGWTP